MTEQTIVQDDQQKKAIDDALTDARQNTTKGQIYQQFYSILLFIAMICVFVSYTVLQLFDSYGDLSLRYPGYLYGSDFYLNVYETQSLESKTLRPSISSHFHHDYYACETLKFGRQQNVSYIFNYESKNQQNGLQFTVPAKFNSSVQFEVNYDQTQQITLIDQLCVKQACVQLKELPNKDFGEQIRCGNKPCVFQVEFKPKRQQVFNISLKMQLQQQRVDTEDCLFFYKQFDFTNYQYLVVKSNFNSKELFGAPNLKIEHQTEVMLKMFQIIGFGSGILVFLVAFLLYKRCKNSWESTIKEKVLSEVLNKQKVQQHIDKIKQAMKNDKK